MRPALVINPRTDDAFVHNAHELIGDGVASVDAMERELRTRYPDAVVHERVLSGESGATWYVYRQGSWVTED
ncbi:MAG TPA: hypothetical protein VMQ65_07010 [Candidatus Limnocylindria bacterium]|nr:hypothetical protein [Candidatus Limnocylindria bacterium]